METNKVENTHISIKGIFLGGLVAGIAICLGAVIMVAPIFGNEIDIVMDNLNLPQLGNLETVFFFGLSFVFGIFLVFLYAALKPQFGSKIKTAIIASLIIWCLAYLLNNISLVVYGFLPIKLAVFVIVWGLIELLLAGIIGTRLYERCQKT